MLRKKSNDLELVPPPSWRHELVLELVPSPPIVEVRTRLVGEEDVEGRLCYFHARLITFIHSILI